MHSCLWRAAFTWLLISSSLSCAGGDSTPPPATAAAIAPSSAAGFLLGANYPWRAYGADFGGNAWGSAGVADSRDYDADFARLRASGVRVLRWFVFGDGRAGITSDRDGTPLGLHPDTLADLDAAVALARNHDTSLVLVLLDFSLLSRARFEGGVQLGGRSDLMTDARKRQALLDRVGAPVLSRHPAETVILAWEVMNEPEWAISDLPGASVAADIRPMTMADFWGFGAAVSSLVHRQSTSKVTVGSASLKWVRVWTDAFASARGLPALSLDFYQVHYYSWMEGKCTAGDPALGDVCWSPLAQPVLGLGLDKPVVVGEIGARSQVGQMLDRLVANGYGGALVWSYRTEDPVDWDAIRTWSAHLADSAAR